MTANNEEAYKRFSLWLSMRVEQEYSRRGAANRVCDIKIPCRVVKRITTNTNVLEYAFMTHELAASFMAEGVLTLEVARWNSLARSLALSENIITVTKASELSTVKFICASLKAMFEKYLNDADSEDE